MRNFCYSISKTRGPSNAHPTAPYPLNLQRNFYIGTQSCFALNTRFCWLRICRQFYVSAFVVVRVSIAYMSGFKCQAHKCQGALKRSLSRINDQFFCCYSRKCNSLSSGWNNTCVLIECANETVNKQKMQTQQCILCNTHLRYTTQNLTLLFNHHRQILGIPPRRDTKRKEPKYPQRQTETYKA